MTLVVRAALTDQPIDSTEHENLVAHESAGGAPTSRPRATRCRSASIAAALG